MLAGIQGYVILKTKNFKNSQYTFIIYYIHVSTSTHMHVEYLY